MPVEMAKSSMGRQHRVKTVVLIAIFELLASDIITQLNYRVPEKHTYPVNTL